MQKYAGLFVHGYYLFLEAHPTAKERLLFIFSISDVPQFVNFMSNKIKFLVKNLIQDEHFAIVIVKETYMVHFLFYVLQNYSKDIVNTVASTWHENILSICRCTFSVTLKLTFFLELHLWKMVHFS